MLISILIFSVSYASALQQPQRLEPNLYALLGQSQHLYYRQPYLHEIPALKRGDMSMSNVQVNSSSFNFSHSQSLTSLIIVSKAGNFYMYAMTLLADSSYLNGNYAKLANNTYRNKDPDFSGNVYYHRMDGSFVNGWRFQNGVVTGVITLAAAGAATTGPVVQSANGQVVDAAAPVCTTTITTTYWEDCSYYTDDVNYENPFNCYIYTTQDSYTSCSVPSGGAGGSSNSSPCTTPPSSGGSSGGSGSTPPSEALRLKVRVLEPPTSPPPGGIMDATNDIGTNECTTQVPLADTTQDPCTQSSKLKNNQPFIKMMDTLQMLKNVSGETSYLMMPNGTEKKLTDAANGGSDLNFQPGYFTGSSGFLHNHGAGAGILSVFSAYDIQSLYTIIKTGNVSNPASFTYGMVNQYGQGYLLVISSMSDFNTWATTYAQSSSGISTFNSLFNNFVNASNSATTNEDNLASLLTLTGSGLTLMKGNSTNTNWSLIVKNADGTFSIVQCNN